MDVFSAGCVIAELFLETPIFSLSQLYKYRKGEYDPYYGYLSKIQDADVRELVSHMVQLEPESRYSAEEYLNFWRRKAFPEYFYSFLHQYMGLITDPASGRSPVLPNAENFGEADDRIDRVYNDFDKISYFLGFDKDTAQESVTTTEYASSDDVIPVQIDIPNNRHRATASGRKPQDDGSLIFLTLVVSSIRNTARSTARVRACDLMLAFAERITDEAKLDRVLPYVVAMLNDKSDIVQAAAIRTMTQVLSLIAVVSPVNAYAFTEYIRPRLQQFTSFSSNKAGPLVRATYASCLASLAHTSMKILDMVQALRADGSIPSADPETEDGVASDLTYRTSFDVAKLDLLEHFEAHTKALLTDSSASVRRAFLGSISSLCVFFGSSRATDVILSHLNTYLNDKDWILKCAFFQTIVGVATFVGGASLEEYILPLMVQALTDPEEFVVEKVLSSFACMAGLGLFQRSTTWEMVEIVGPFLIHPNIWIREAAAHFVSASTRYLAIADLHCIIAPLLQPYLKISVVNHAEIDLLDALRKPLPRPILDMAAIWAAKRGIGLFWKPAPQQRNFALGSVEKAPPTAFTKNHKPHALDTMTKNEEDEQWIKRLRNIGMNAEDEFKLLALRDYIWRVSTKASAEGIGNSSFPLNQVIPLKDINVTPQTIFFETLKGKDKPRQRASSGERGSRNTKGQPATTSHTIADALLDASTATDNPMTRQKLSRANASKESANGGLATQPLDVGTGRGPSNVTLPFSASPGRPSKKAAPKIDIGPRRSSDIDGAYSDGALTPTGSVRGNGLGKGEGIRHKSSAINLLNRRDIPKSFAETSTSSANVMGKMEGPSVRDPLEGLADVRKVLPSGSRDSPVHASHTYDGNDPNVLQLLDSLAIDNFPVDEWDFGPFVASVASRHPLTKKADSQAIESPWRPDGVLVATFGEHTGPINRVVASPDHVFFVTCSDDSTVKVWDTSRLERNLAHRSRQTLSHVEGAKVKCLCFIENTHTFVSAADDGSIKVVKVVCSVIGDTSKYGKLRVMREFKLPEGQSAVWLEHSRVDMNSVLLIATNTSNIIALDLRHMKQLYTLENPIQHGTPTCFCVDYKRGWLLVGTSHGILDLWDLRFRLRLKAWGLAGATPIHRLLKHPFRTRGKKVCVAGGTGQTDITVWDLEKGECCEVFRASVPKGSGKDSLKPYEAWKVDEEKREGMLDRFATAIDSSGNGSNSLDIGVRALAVGIDFPDDKWDGKYGFFLTGGVDKKLRFWDQVHADASMVISGLDTEEDQPKFTTIHPTPGLTMHMERTSQQAPSAPNAAAGTKAASSKKAGLKQPRNTLITLQQQALLRNHLDIITDVCVLSYPVGMTVSVDRMGCIYVYQ